MTTSIIIANYNNGRWLRHCVDSALGQTRPADEVIVYDDASTDDSVAILRSYGDRIRLLVGTHPKDRHGRACHARALFEAFQASSGSHVHLLDGDDVYRPGRLEAYARAWGRCPEAVLVQAAMDMIDEEGALVGSGRVASRHGVNHLEQYYRKGETDLFYPASALAFRRDYLERMLPLDFADAAGNDSAVDMRLSLPAPWFGPVLCLDESLTCYRLRTDSLSASRLGGTHRHKLLLTRMKYCHDHAARLGQRRLPFWKNPAYWRGTIRGKLPRWLGDRIAGWLFARRPAA